MADRKLPPDQDGPRPPDPYLDWAIATDFRYCRPGEWLPLLVRFVETTPADDPLTPLQRFRKLGWLGEEWRSSVLIAEPFLELPDPFERSGEIRFCVLMIKLDQARGILDDAGWLRTIAEAEVGPPVQLPLRPSPPRAPAQGPSVTGRVLMAVLDEGIAYAHERFRDGGRSRIEYLWRQDSNDQLTAADVEARLTQFTAHGRTDEERLYQAPIGTDFAVDGFKALARRRSHGTHVLDLAAGARNDRAPRNRPIVAVELPSVMVADPSLTPLYAHILLGLVYVLRCAQLLRRGGTLPVVANISYGPHHGPHDGTSLFERLLDQLIAMAAPSDTPLTVVLAAGNFRQSRVHARFGIDAGQSSDVGWRLQPEDLTPSSVEFWVSSAGSAAVDLSLTVTSPNGDAIAVSPLRAFDRFPNARPELFRATYTSATSSPGRTRVVVTALPTAAAPPLTSAPVAPPGRWTLRFTNLGSSRVEVEGWIWRDAPIGGRRARGRQSYFDDPAYVRHDFTGRQPEFDPTPGSYVVREGTLSGIATSAVPIVVGGFRRKSAPPSMPASYSSMGPGSGTPPTRIGPTAAAPSDDSSICRGILAAGTRSGSATSMNGTSVAAPIMARYVADEIASGSIAVPPLPPLDPAPPTIPAAIASKVVGAGCLVASPYPDTPLRNERL